MSKVIINGVEIDLTKVKDATITDTRTGKVVAKKKGKVTVINGSNGTIKSTGKGSVNIIGNYTNK